MARQPEPAMGTLRLGTLPDTRPWREVVARLAEGDDVARVAQATTSAASRGLNRARGDEGVAAAVCSLAGLVRCARADDFTAALRGRGLDVPDRPEAFDLVGALSRAISDHLTDKACRTDLGEMAALAAVEALTAQLSARTASLFESGTEEVRRAAREMSTDMGFASLAHDFVARFAQRFLTYHLGRELSNHVGGNGRFADPDAHNQFVADLAVHCRQAAAIMHDYAADWYSKAVFLHGEVTLADAQRFADTALRKLRGELERRGARHAD